MLRHSVLGPVLLSMLLGACSETVDPTDPAMPETAEITATVVTRNADGQQVTRTETFTQDQFEAMIAARVARQSIQAPGDTQPAGTGVIRSSISTTSCADGNALWMWNVANGWTNPTGAKMLCVIGAGTFTLGSVPGWDLAVRSIWPGNEAGGIWPGNVGECNLDCTTPSSIAGFPVWGARENTPGCTNGRFVLLADSPISCWVP